MMGYYINGLSFDFLLFSFIYFFFSSLLTFKKFIIYIDGAKNNYNNSPRKLIFADEIFLQPIEPLK